MGIDTQDIYPCSPTSRSFYEVTYHSIDEEWCVLTFANVLQQKACVVA